MSDSLTILLYKSKAGTVKIFHADDHFDGLVEARRNSSALAMELCLSYTNP